MGASLLALAKSIYYIFIFGGIVKAISMISCNFSSCTLTNILKICMDVLCFVAL